VAKYCAARSAPVGLAPRKAERFAAVAVADELLFVMNNERKESSKACDSAEAGP